MSAPLRVSARTLAEYTFFEEDILPAGPALMEKGQRGHIARQKASPMEKEAALSWEGECAGLSFYVSGRADLMQRQPLAIEEIKLCDGDAPPAAKPAHRAQAVIYAYMALREAEERACAVCVRYVRESGETVAAFEERLTIEEAEGEFFALLTPYAEKAKKEETRRAARDASLDTLPFPYTAFRLGQRGMAAQVYTAIVRRRRLFAQMPTGSGKSAAVLYPAMKALGRGETRQVFFLTARTTGRRAAMGEMANLQAHGARAVAVCLTAKEKCCPMEDMRCDPAHCPRAKGHFVREREALQREEARLSWDEAAIAATADEFSLCPFELSLTLAGNADAVVCDYNYAFDPQVRLERVFLTGVRPTVLMDEAHNLEDRVRDMLSCALSSSEVALWRRETGRALGRAAPAYRALTRCIQALRAVEREEGALDAASLAASEAWEKAKGIPLSFGRALYRTQFLLGRAARKQEDYACIVQKRGRERTIGAMCLNITDYIRGITARFTGSVYFSATLLPLASMRTLLGGGEEDACFQLPSPFPKEHLLALQLNIDTRYARREETLPLAAQAIRAMYGARPGHYLACFPSYRYLESVRALLDGLPLHVQQEGMGEAERESYLRRFEEDKGGVLGLCVLGGAFSESIDLKGSALIGVCVVGVGLPTVSDQKERLRAFYEGSLGQGFDFAYRYPGMHRVLQAAGRVIRTGEDRGVALFLDDRYGQSAYRALLPEHLDLKTVPSIDALSAALLDFWSQHGIE